MAHINSTRPFYTGPSARQRGPELAHRHCLGRRGPAGGYVGARMPETVIRRLLALMVVAIGIRFLVAGLTSGA
jgi:hypothetical protein